MKLGCSEAIANGTMNVAGTHLLPALAGTHLLPALVDAAIALEDADDPIALEDADDPFADLLGEDLFADDDGGVQKFSISLRGRSVRFDGAKHQTGEQRGWITCNESKRHNGCFKYRFVRDFGGCHRSAAAWLLAWDCQSKDYDTRQAHYKEEPPEALVARLRGLLGL